MSDWPTAITSPNVTISTLSPECAAEPLAAMNKAGFGNFAPATYPVSNAAFFVPFVVCAPSVVVKMFTYNGSTVSGNIDVGIYDMAGTRLVSIGSTAQAGAASIQEYNITDTTIGPGAFYLAVALDNTTGTLQSASVTIPQATVIGMAQMTSAFPLPATATFATMASAFFPVFGLTLRTVV